MDTITGGPAGFPLFVYLIREWLLLYDSPRKPDDPSVVHDAVDDRGGHVAVA